MKAESQPVANGDADPDDLDDAAVIRLSRREPEQFAILFRRHAPQIQRYVVRRLGPDADDDVAETFLLAFRQLHPSRPVAAEICAGAGMGGVYGRIPAWLAGG
jgi:hypothetical protein